MWTLQLNTLILIRLPATMALAWMVGSRTSVVLDLPYTVLRLTTFTMSLFTDASWTMESTMSPLSDYVSMSLIFSIVRCCNCLRFASVPATRITSDLTESTTFWSPCTSRSKLPFFVILILVILFPTDLLSISLLIFRARAGKSSSFSTLITIAAS